MTRLQMPDGAIVSAPEGFDNMGQEDQQKAVEATVHAYQAYKGANKEPQPQQYDDSGASVGSLVNAAGRSVWNGLPAALENGTAVLGRSIAPEAGKSLWDDLSRRAEGNRQDQAQGYQRPASIDPSVSHALSQGHVKGALTSLLYSAAENAGPTAALLGTAAIPGAGVPLAASLGAIEGADNVSQQKKAAGLKDSDRLNSHDALDVAVQAGLNALPTLKAGKLVEGVPLAGDIIPNRFGHALISTADQTARGMAGNAVDQANIASQGGNVGTASDVIRNMADAGLSRGAVAAVPHVTGAGAEGVKALNFARNRYLTNYGRGLSEYQKGVQAGVPIAQMSDRARDAIASLDYGSSIQDRKAAQSGNASDAATANGELGAAKLQIQAIRDHMKANPAGSGVTASPAEIDRTFNEAIREAQNHNMKIAPDSEGNASPTAHQRLAAMLPDEVWRPIEARLNTMDRLSSDRIQKRTKAVTAPVLKALGGAAIPATLALTGGEYGHPLEGLGAAATALLYDATRGANRTANDHLDRLGNKIDKAIGLGVPTGLRNMSQKLALADRMGIEPRPIGEQLNDIEAAAREAALSNIRGRQQRAAPPSPQGPITQGPSGPQPAPLPQMPNRPAPQGPQGPQAMPNQQPPSGPAQSSSQAPQPVPQTNLPMAHTAGEIMAQRVPGWVATTAERNPNISKTSIMSYLSNRLADNKLTPEEYQYLTSKDNIGDNLGAIQSEIGGIAHAGQWDKASAFRDPNAASTIRNIQTAIDMAQGRAGQDTATPSRADVDHDGNPIRNRMSYAAEIARAASVGKSIADANPHLSGAVAKMQAEKTPDNRTKVMMQEIKKLPQELRGSALVKLMPLTAFGYKGKKEVK